MASHDPKSRLPLPHGTQPAPNLKRKASEDISGPSKVPAKENAADPTRPASRTGIATAPAVRPIKPLPASSNRAPLKAKNSQSTLGRGVRAGSEPPKSRPITGIVNGRRANADSTLGRSGVKRSASGSHSRPIPTVMEEEVGELHQQGGTLASILEADRATKADLEAFKFEMETKLKGSGSEIRRGMIAAADELDDLKRRHAREIQELHAENARKDRELEEGMNALRELGDDLARERDTVRTLKNALSEQSNAHVLLKTQFTALETKCDALSSEGQAQLNSKAKLTAELQAAKARAQELENELMEAESLRRKLHNQIQELKGNIRVFCRVRPALAQEKNSSDGLATINFPDKSEHKEIVISSTTETAMGHTRDTILPFSFDRVFEPRSSQHEVFEEISHLVQSCIDGYNICIFAYGQTGSGKSFTMEGGSTEETRGMIPRAVRHVFQVAQQLQKKGWSYRMEGQFLEIYNETIVDLLGKGNDGKHEIKHEKNGRTTVTDVVVYPLRSPDQVQNLLNLAQSRRTVHATLMNERSSRSHSVFTLRIIGTNDTSGETSEGCLNLVDLAGSERLKESGASSDKNRLKETQAINKSLSALGDVIAALGEKGSTGDKHIPYRNSKLTYLLQNSLSGNSKTLMFVNVSPLAASLGESICSLRFATKVNNTTLGTAKKQTARLS
ncbi:kinesin-like nuclear fusion protein [Tulasnella sp. UAMH 9824]|nr:kinesin-like nuclear fusion protein [Tulasnella sp. UAMH 9824]